MEVREVAVESAVQNFTDAALSESILSAFAHQCIRQRFIASALTGIDGPFYVFSAGFKRSTWRGGERKVLAAKSTRGCDGEDREVIGRLVFAERAEAGRGDRRGAGRKGPDGPVKTFRPAHPTREAFEITGFRDGSTRPGRCGERSSK
ncbi:hypothetical protein [Streptomyces hygroscopicus]|uniref:hypothetical protein n=1 Tax=Streptomyces hygroscopicus TaxID=1912 RepID=UPI00368A842B